MPLRLRRGTDAERQAFTPAEAELVYTTDSKEVWVGDGSTLGGTRVTASNTGSFEGSFTGNVTGDLVGSVFADDSSLIIDAVNDVISISNISPRSSTITVERDTTGQTTLKTSGVDDKGVLLLSHNTVSDLSGDTTTQYGSIWFERNDFNGPLVTSVIFGRENSLYFGNSSDGNMLTSDKYFVWKNNNLGVRVTDPTEVLDVDGNAKVSGFVQFGSVTTIERNGLTAANGMVVYNTTDNKFQGYQNGSWINLDDGTPA